MQEAKCYNTLIQGGRWSAGFWSGFASSALAPLASSASTLEGKVALSAVVGGTASELGGGKFANGAVTAAFVMMYNRKDFPDACIGWSQA